MKLELDLSDRKALLATRNELSHALLVVEAALQRNENGEIPAPAIDRDTILNRLPNRFRISNLLELGLNRAAARRSILGWIEAASVRIVEHIRGSQGNVYEKVT